MKTYNHFYENPKLFRSYLDGIGLDYSGQFLVRIHSTMHDAENIIPVAETVQKTLPGAVIIGCSTSGVICEGKIHENACLVSITETEGCEIRSGMFSCKDESGDDKDGAVLGQEVCDALIRGEQGMFLTFFPVSYYKTATFVQAVDQENPGLIMAGGVSYMNVSLQEGKISGAYVLSGTQVSATSMTGVMIVSPALHIYENVVNGVEPVGKSYEVTKADGHFLEEIDGTDAAAWYEQMLGADQLREDASLAGVFPLIKEGTRQSYNVIYEPYETLPQPWKSQKQNRINLFSEMAVGTRVSLGYFDPHKIVQQMSDVYSDLQQQPVEILFGYDCLARMWTLHDCAAWEIEQFYTTNMSGAMLAGEIGHVDGHNLYANSTFVIAGLSEDANAHILLKEKELQNVAALQYDNVQMINYLLTMGNRQLNQQLDEQQDKIQRALFYNEGLNMNNQTKYLYDNEKQPMDKIAVFSLKNKRILRLFLGRNAMLKELRSIYADAVRILGDPAFRLYSYGEHSLLVAAGDDLDWRTFKEAIQELFNALNNIKRKDIAFSYDCAMAFYDKDPFPKMEAALQYGEEKKLHFVIYNDIPETESDMEWDMHMLQIIRDALVHDRIVPYFQGIYDNREGRINMYEALIRIQDEEGNLYFPYQFLTLAKQYNLYEALSNMMVEKVMRMFLNKNIRVTINLNVQDLYDREMIRTIFYYLEQERHPENFVFELLESEEVQDYKFIKQFANSVHEYGAKIAIDDFGSGYSNIIHIIRIEADIIKIDGSIIKDICDDESCQEFLSMVHDWCSRRDKEVVAEFVENARIQYVMETIGITYSQGYHFAKPQTWEDCEKARAEAGEA